MAGFKVLDVAPPNESVVRTLTVLGQPCEVEYYRNRITLERDGAAISRNGTGTEDDEDEAPDEEARTARDLCYILKSWDCIGPVVSRNGTVLVADDAPIPLEPAVVACLPLTFTNPLTTAIIEDAFPNRSSGRGSRRR